MLVRCHGVRGSVPRLGRRNSVYGGNTICLQVEIAGRTILVDAGTGLSDATPDLSRPVNMLFSHLHLDHVIGLGSFGPLFAPGARVIFWCGHLGGASPEEPLRRLLSPPLFPVTFDQVAAEIEFRGFRAGETIDVDGVPVATHPLAHPDGATAFRFADDGASVVTAFDMEHAAGGPDPALVAFCKGADVLLYDAAYREEDYPRFRGWGHSTHGEGLKLARAAGAKRLVCLHHAPIYEDLALGEVSRALAGSTPPAELARDGDVIVPGRR